MRRWSIYIGVPVGARAECVSALQSGAKGGVGVEACVVSDFERACERNGKEAKE